jgi:N-acetyl-anhydromuramyl-L-alanine amidase AmpD
MNDEMNSGSVECAGPAAFFLRWAKVLDIVRRRLLWSLFILALLAGGCGTLPRAGRLEPRQGDEIVAAGQFFHTGTRVVLWLDPGGYDAYRVERRFAPLKESGWESSRTAVTNLTSPNRYGLRRALETNEIERVRGGGWDLPLLQRVIDQLVLHYDAAGTSENCFRILQDERGLSVHFLLDLDGTIYQTLDLKERAPHATIANDRSIGVEMANIGAYPTNRPNPFAEWYRTNASGQVVITIPDRFGDGGIRTRHFIGRPARNELVEGAIHGEEFVQYDFTPQQYAALTQLTASLCRIFPRLTCQYPTDEKGNLIRQKLSETEFKNYHGVLGHYHIQRDKIDPGPALDWDRVIGGARRILGIAPPPKPATGPLLTPRARDLLR